MWSPVLQLIDARFCVTNAADAVAYTKVSKLMLVR